MTHVEAHAAVGHAPPRRAPYDRRDVMVLGGALAAAAVLAALASVGGAPRLQPLVGLIVILSLAYAISTNRRAIDGRTVAWGLSLQLAVRTARPEEPPSASACSRPSATS